MLILLFFIGASIALHEIGHMLPAKKFGVKVTEYSIGFGPTMWRRRRGETEYQFRLLPIGGFIRMIGMYAPSRKDNKLVGGRFANTILQARLDSASDIGPDEDHRTFYRLSVPKRLIVMVGGPAMNLVIATVLFIVVLCGIGQPFATAHVENLVPCVPTAASPNGDGTIAGCVDTMVSPAIAAGFKSGDQILSIGGKEVRRWIDISTFLDTAKPGDVVKFQVLTAAGTSEWRTVTLADAEYPSYDNAGNLTGKTWHRGFVGLSPQLDWAGASIVEVPGVMWHMTTASVAAIGAFPQKIYALVGTMLSGGARDPNGPVSVVGATRISGDIAASDQSIRAKAAQILGLAASLNLFLFLFNLLPLLPLDGGHAAGAIYEGARRKLAQWRKQSDPGPVDVARALPLTYAFTLLLLLAGVIVIVADLVAPISLTN